MTHVCPFNSVGHAEGDATERLLRQDNLPTRLIFARGVFAATVSWRKQSTE
jgi:hypothetical protein